MRSPLVGSHQGNHYHIHLHEDWGKKGVCSTCQRFMGYERRIYIQAIQNDVSFGFPNSQSSVWKHFASRLHEAFPDNTCLCANCLTQAEQRIADHLK